MVDGTDKTVDWLLTGDPAIRWQTLRDLAGAKERAVEAERKNVARDGWGARLLKLTKFSFPPRWHYDMLRALDYFQAVGAPRDPRLSEAIDIVHGSRGEDGRWSLQNVYRGKTYFEVEKLGAPRRWNTLRALRVLKWWEGGAVKH